ncbi:hypothetical protein NDU88_006970 [Pleurodeles waltl]|uniref:Uncharacterized protein n=1 Tax=Pleurodeles waltl TaxID=8319 RepID=A0AAV7SRG1_PLEWA|nr:hypothetical protein NDU88_006970 [Pleurodeles waltl]
MCNDNRLPWTLKQHRRNYDKPNQKTSEKKRVRYPDFQIDDFVIVKDRHPGWKFRNLYESDMCRVAQVEGTMVTIQRNGRNVTRNASWFKQVLVSDETDDGHSLEVEEEDVAGGPLSLTENGKAQSGLRCGATQEQCPLGPQEPSCGVSGESVGRREKYNLHPNPTPSQQLRDFVCCT